MASTLLSPRTLLLTTVATLALTGCTKPKQTTAVGSVAGGAIGAGLGAIVGNQTGNAGSGVAIGAVAGAATGALIGNALQAQQEKVDSQRETLQRQEQSIRAQRSEIEELRRMQSDTGYSSARTQNVNAYLVEQKRLQLQKRGPSPRGQSGGSSYTPPPLSMKASEPLARYDEKPTSPTTTARTTAPLAVKSSAPVGKGIEEKDLSSTTSTKPREVPAEAVPVNAAPVQAVPVESKTETTTAKVVESTQATGGCAEGKEARDAAAAASEDSDKLFHLRKALRLCPQSAETHYELGKAYLHMSRAADANYEFKQALSIDPSFKPAQEGLKEVDQGGAKY
jgi:tetratricopeptide (TPR) repeat protein